MRNAIYVSWMLLFISLMIYFVDAWQVVERGMIAGGVLFIVLNALVGLPLIVLNILFGIWAVKGWFDNHWEMSYDWAVPTIWEIEKEGDVMRLLGTILLSILGGAITLLISIVEIFFEDH